MALSLQDLALLAQYRSAYAALISGELVSEVSSGGRTMKYVKADLGRLEAEIARLEDADNCRTPRRRRGAVGFTL